MTPSQQLSVNLNAATVLGMRPLPFHLRGLFRDPLDGRTRVIPGSAAELHQQTLGIFCGAQSKEVFNLFARTEDCLRVELALGIAGGSLEERAERIANVIAKKVLTHNRPV